MNGRPVKKIFAHTAAIFFVVSGVSFGTEAGIHDNGRVSEIVARLEKMRDASVADIRTAEANIQKSKATITRSQAILEQARLKGNARAEEIARKALSTAQAAQNKNMIVKARAERNKARTDEALDYVRRGGAAPEALLEQVEYESMNDAWLQRQRQTIEARLKNPNPYAEEIYRSLKTQAPPALPDTGYDQLQPGDVLLISPESENLWDRLRDTSWWITAGDSISSAENSPASHTVLYLKEVNGKKLFLDNTSEKGAHVIDEREFLKTYGHRKALAASVAQPLNEEESGQLWHAAKEMVKNEAGIQQRSSGKYFDQSGYGLYGNENMVCSEASRWALVRAGRDIPESASPFKKALGIDYGPANFFSDRHAFIITPLWEPVER